MKVSHAKSLGKEKRYVKMHITLSSLIYANSLKYLQIFKLHSETRPKFTNKSVIKISKL